MRKNRLFLASIVTLAFLLMAASSGYCAKPSENEAVNITFEKITDNLYTCVAPGTPSFVIGEKEVLVIDTGKSPEYGKILIEEIQKITPKPVTKVVLTHGDVDHVFGLGGFPEGVDVVTSPECKKVMEEYLQTPRFEALQSRLPGIKTFTGTMELDFPGEKIQLINFGPAHSGTDVVVYVPAGKTVFIGDLVINGRDAVLHRHLGGNSGGLVNALKSLVALDADKYVSGHDVKVLSKGQIEASLMEIEEKVATVKSMAQQEKSLEEIKNHYSIVDKPYFPGGPIFPSSVEVIYLELTAD